MMNINNVKNKEVQQMKNLDNDYQKMKIKGDKIQEMDLEILIVVTIIIEDKVAKKIKIQWIKLIR